VYMPVYHPMYTLVYMPVYHPMYTRVYHGVHCTRRPPGYTVTCMRGVQ